MSETSNNFNFSLTNLISGLTICAFLLGVVNLYIYNLFFSFNIFNYIGITEIAIHVIQYGVSIITGVIILLLFGTIYGKKATFESFLERSKPNQQASKFSVFFPFIIIITVLITFIYLYYINKVGVAFLIYGIFTIFTPFFYELPSIIYTQLSKNYGIKLNFFTFIFLNVATLSVTTGIIVGLLSVNNIKNGHSSFGTYIIVGKDSIKSTKIYYYIGRTDNYVFYYNEKLKFTDVFPQNQITKLSLKD